jgi:hypothetical protein
VSVRSVAALRSDVHAAARYHQVGALAAEIFALPAHDPDAVALRRELADVARASGLGDVADHQAAYAVRLARSPGDLIYEEMHKLLSLASETHALQGLGFPLSDGRREEMEAALRHRFSAQQRVARMAAEDKVDEANRHLWWFAELTGRR